jgi:hypothetical protein
VHDICVAVSTLQDFYTFIGPNMSTPPNPPPSYAPLEYCSMHATLDRKCHKCITIKNSDEPKQPRFFYETISVSFKARFVTGGDVVVGWNEGKRVHFTGRNDATDTVMRGWLCTC